MIQASPTSDKASMDVLHSKAGGGSAYLNLLVPLCNLGLPGLARFVHAGHTPLGSQLRDLSLIVCAAQLLLEFCHSVLASRMQKPQSRPVRLLQAGSRGWMVSIVRASGKMIDGRVPWQMCSDCCRSCSSWHDADSTLLQLRSQKPAGKKTRQTLTCVLEGCMPAAR